MAKVRGKGKTEVIEKDRLAQWRAGAVSYVRAHCLNIQELCIQLLNPQKLKISFEEIFTAQELANIGHEGSCHYPGLESQ